MHLSSLRRTWMVPGILILASACASHPTPRAGTPGTPQREAQAAREGADALLRLGRHYAAHDDRHALGTYRRAARLRPVERAVAQAEFELGGIYGSGRIDPGRPDSARIRGDSNQRQARRWMHRSAGHGFDLAMLWLAVDAGRNQDPALEARWNLRAGMTRGDLFQLARTRDALRDRDDGGFAASYTARTQEAASRGDSEALVDMGLLWHLGIGVDQDHARAYACFERAGRLGNPFGMHFAGLMVVREYRPDVAPEDAGAWFDAAYADGFYPAQHGLEKRLELPEFGG